MGEAIKFGRGLVVPEYTRLDYIAATGTQYIDTKFIPNQDTRVAAEVVMPVASSVNWLFGARGGAQDRAFCFLTVGNYYRSDYGAAQYAFGTTVSFTGDFTIDFNKNAISLNSSNSGTMTASTFTAPCSLVLLGNNNNGSVTPSTGAKIYSCQIYDNGTLVRDYIPAKYKDGKIGLWDKVEKKFYGNAGSGAFTAA